MADEPVTTKRCAKCDLWLDRALFHRETRSRDGLTSWCKLCVIVKRQTTFETRDTKRKLTKAFCLQGGIEQVFQQADDVNRLKQCSKCKQWLDRSFFSNDKNRLDGLYCNCKTCMSVVSKASYSTWSDERKAAHFAKAKSWKIENKKRTQEYQRLYATEHSEECHATKKRWRVKNIDKHRVSSRATRAKRRCVVGSFTASDIADIFKLQSGKCAYCRKNLKRVYHADHIVPIKLGGTNDRQNIQLTCARCNLTKNAKHPLDFARSLGRLL